MFGQGWGPVLIDWLLVSALCFARQKGVLSDLRANGTGRCVTTMNSTFCGPTPDIGFPAVVPRRVRPDEKTSKRSRPSWASARLFRPRRRLRTDELECRSHEASCLEDRLTLRPFG